MRVFILAAFLTTARAQAADPVRAAMEASLEKQRQSIRSQVASAVKVETPPSSDFFTVAWPNPAALLPPACDALAKPVVEQLIAETSTREGVKADLLREVMQRESAFRPCAVSAKGAQGLMQLMPATAQQFGVGDPFDPQQNLTAGAKFLKQLLEKYNGDHSLALAAYNAGPATVDKTGTVPNIAETQTYVKEILKKLLL